MSKVISAEVPDELAERVEDYQADDESRSAAVRRLVRTGLDAEDKPEGIVMSYPSFVGLMGWFGVFAGAVDAVPIVAQAGAAVIALSVIWGLADRTNYQIPYTAN